VFEGQPFPLHNEALQIGFESRTCKKAGWKPRPKTGLPFLEIEQDVRALHEASSVQAPNPRVAPHSKEPTEYFVEVRTAEIVEGHVPTQEWSDAPEPVNENETARA